MKCKPKGIFISTHRGCAEIPGALTRRYLTSLLQGFVQSPKLLYRMTQHWQYLVGRETGTKKKQGPLQREEVFLLFDYRGNVKAITSIEERRHYTPFGHSEWTTQPTTSSFFWQQMMQASEWTPGHLKCTRIWMAGLFAKLLLLFWARRSKMCFPYTFQLLSSIGRHSWLERESKPKLSSWIVFPQFLPAFTLQNPIWQILPLLGDFQLRTNKVLSQSDIK